MKYCLFPTLLRPIYRKQTHDHIPTRDLHFGFETSWFRDFCHLFEDFGFGEFGLRKKYRFRRISSRKKSLDFGLGEFGLQKKFVSVSENLVSEKTMVSVSENSFSEKSLGSGKNCLKKVSVLENLV